MEATPPSHPRQKSSPHQARRHSGHKGTPSRRSAASSTRFVRLSNRTSTPSSQTSPQHPRPPTSDPSPRLSRPPEIGIPSGLGSACPPWTSSASPAGSVSCSLLCLGPLVTDKYTTSPWHSSELPVAPLPVRMLRQCGGLGPGGARSYRISTSNPCTHTA